MTCWKADDVGSDSLDTDLHGQICDDPWTAEAIRTDRARLDRDWYPAALSKRRSRFAVHVRSKRIAGVNVEEVVARSGASDRLLLNLHGGGFIFGGSSSVLAEAIPLAASGRFRVAGPDYALAPEHPYPAAVDDAVAVYRAYLDLYPADNIGLCGCSAGALLTAQVIARLLAERLPLPAAVGLFFGGACYWMEGESGRRYGRSSRWALDDPREHPWFAGSGPADPQVFPLLSDGIMAQFPPALLISGERDYSLSSVLRTHASLAALGREADLQVWEGLGHAFFYDNELTQSDEAYARIVAYFDHRLGLNAKG